MISSVPHAFMRPFVDVGDGKIRGDSPQSQPVMWGSDPFLIEIEGRMWIFKTHGPTLPQPPGGGRRGSPGIYAFSRDQLGLDDWHFEGIVLRPWGNSPVKPPEFHDTEGIETFSACQIGPHLVGMYGGYDSTKREPLTITDCYIAHAFANDPARWNKIQPVISEAQAKAADPRLTLVINVGEASLQWDPVGGIVIGTMGIRGIHGSDTPPDIANPFGGKAGECWRTYLIASKDFIHWTIYGPIVLPPETFQSSKASPGCSQTSQSACVLDPRSPRVLHVFTDWGGNWDGGKPHPHNPKGIRHWAGLYDEWPIVFHPNPNGVAGDGADLLFNSVRPINSDPVSEDGGQAGSPAPLLRFLGGDRAEPWEWSMVFHAANTWRRDNGTPAERKAIKELETTGRHHTRLAVESASSGDSA